MRLITADSGPNYRVHFKLSQGSDDTLYAWTIAYGMRPPNRDEAICRNEYEAALNRVYGARFRNTSEKARWHYEHDPRFMASVHTARQREGGCCCGSLGGTSAG